MTQLEAARDGKVTPEMEKVAREEELDASRVRELIAEGKAVIPVNRKRRDFVNICGAGLGMSTKVNANIGSSMDVLDLEMEMEKLRMALEAKTDMVMDLSTGGEIPLIREKILEKCNVPLGTVPVYETAAKTARDKGGIRMMDPDDMIATIKRHAEQGVDFVTVHCGVTRDVAKTLDEDGRICSIVSRGGMFLYAWMRYNKQENPYFERFDELIDICREHDMTISLGDGLRPGAISDAFDRAQVHELQVMSELCGRAQKAGVQVMIEGPGHVPLDQVAAQVKLQKSLTNGAPFYVLGPLVTDIAPGYDHMVGAIGGAHAAMAGADILCYLTPAEHLGLPDPQDVYDGVIATRIAAHSGDIAKGIKRAWKEDLEFSKKRKARDWEYQISNSIDPKTAREKYEKKKSGHPDQCTMCGPYCVFKVADEDENN